MLQVLRNFSEARLLSSEDEFWEYCHRSQRMLYTPKGEPSKAEWELDFRAAEKLKALFEREVGPEEGEGKVHSQNWDWNDDRRRAIYMLKSHFKPSLLLSIRSLLTGEHEDFQVILVIHVTWVEPPWGSVLLSKNLVAMPKFVVSEFAVAA